MNHTCPSAADSSTESSSHLSGIAVSPGVGLGQALWIDQLVFPSSSDELSDNEVETQLEIFDCARQRVLADLQQEMAAISFQLQPHEVAILDSHVSMLNDRALISNIRAGIADSRQPLSNVISNVMDDYEKSLSAATSDYLSARIDDIRDVLSRVQRYAHFDESDQAQSPDDVKTPIVVVADELLPSHVTALRDRNVVAIATVAGGRTSHAAILARAIGIPAVAGLGSELCGISNGTTVVVDGRTGHLIARPSDEAMRKYRQEIREIGQLKAKLARLPQGPIQTTDGTKIELLANISNAVDAKSARNVGADGIGLLRTEFYYLSHQVLPDENAEVAALLETAAAAPPGRLVVRTLDVGGDKTIPHLMHAPEANPFLGWRSIRLSFEHPEVFVQQLRAILRAAADASSEFNLLFPMVTTKTEWQRIKRFVVTAREQLLEDGISCPESLPLGVMIEVPAAALCVDHFLPEVDFVSIGTNDLVQYVTAADRDNPKVSHLCQSLSPAMLRLLCATITKCNDAQVPVSVCGEMAGSVRAFLPLLGMGLRSFSMSPAFIPAIRDLATHVSRQEAEAILAEVMRLETSEAIQNVLDSHLLRLRAELSALLLG